MPGHAFKLIIFWQIEVQLQITAEARDQGAHSYYMTDTKRQTRNL